MSRKDGKFDDFKVVNRIRHLNLWLKILLGITLYCGLNFLASRHYMRWDLSENMRNSLSPESAAYVKNLRGDVEIFVVMSKSGGNAEAKDIDADLRALLSQYEYLSRSDAKVKVEYVDAYVENKKAERLAERFGRDFEDCVIVASGNKFKRIPISDFYDVEDGVRTNFKGESVVSSAILNVVSQRDNKIYFLKGHGEMNFRGSDFARGLSEFASALEARNYKLAELDLSAVKQVPEDAGMVVIAGASAPLLPREIDALRKYLLHSNGKMAIFLSMGSMGGLEDILFEWGLRSDDMLILDSSGDYESSTGDLIARSFPQEPHPISKYLIAADMPVQFGSARPVRPDMGAPMDDSLQLDSVILSGKNSWAEKSYRRGGEQSYDDAEDLPGPLPLAMVAARTGSNELGLRIPSGRLVVFGDENFIANKWYNRLGNAKLVLNAVNWLFDENNMLNIAPRRLDTYSLSLSRSDTAGLAWRFSVPALCAAFVCLAVFIARRR